MLTFYLPRMPRTVVQLRAPATGWPLRLADLHRQSAVGDRFEFRAARNAARRRDVVEGGGYEVEALDGTSLLATRARMLPDYVAPGLRVLFVGLNPSEYAAD